LSTLAARDADARRRPTSSARFAIILTITGDRVTRFQMLEDSFDVSKAARL
jgi:hypothetical protein